MKKLQLLFLVLIIVFSCTFVLADENQTFTYDSEYTLNEVHDNWIQGMWFNCMIPDIAWQIWLNPNCDAEIKYIVEMLSENKIYQYSHIKNGQIYVFQINKNRHYEQIQPAKDVDKKTGI